MRTDTAAAAQRVMLTGEPGFFSRVAVYGTGKTWTGSNWVLSCAMAQPRSFWGIAAPTIGDLERVCLTGESGVLSVAEPGDIADYNVNKSRVTLSNGSVIQGFSADSPERARGTNLYGCWCDELAQFRYDSFYHEVLQPALRRGDARMLITTTPKRQRLLRQILRRAEDPANHIHVTRASSDENPFFSTVRLAELKASYAGTRLYKQEIEGVFNDDVVGALFTLDMISEARVDPDSVPDLARVVVAVDPAQTSSEGSDESGIIVAGDDGQGHAYVLADYSLRGSPDQVMRRAVAAWQTHSADVIVFEDQSGGDWLITALRHVDPNVPYKKIHAMRGKYLRAQPVAMLMEQGRIHHAGTAEDFERLEDQLCAITEDSDRSKAHDDRADSYVYAISELRGLSGGSYMAAYSMVKCEECRHVYKDDKIKCPRCGLERDIIDPPERQKGPGSQFREGEGLAGWAEVYNNKPQESAAERNARFLEQVISLQQGNMTGQRQRWSSIWKRERYR
jgi:predicted phage terminase large subunit-like protein